MAELHEWILIYATTEPWKAALRQGMLEENGLECVVVNKQDSAYLFGEIEIYVKPEQALQARTLLSQTEDE